MENLKLKNSAEAQEVLLDMGCKWGCGSSGILYMSYKYLYAEDNILKIGLDADIFSASSARHITLDELRTYKPMLTHTEVIERLKNGLGVEIERKPSEWVKLTKFDSLKVLCSDYKFRGCE